MPSRRGAALGLIAALALAGCGGSKNSGSSTTAASTPASTPATTPATTAQTTPRPAPVPPPPPSLNLAAAAHAAGCTVKSVPLSVTNRQRNHTTAPVHYKENPPFYGNHYPVPASDGNYVGRQTPPIETLVHSLEHGRIEFQYKPGLAAADIAQLEGIYKEQLGQFGPGAFLLLFANPTNMPYEVAATAWGHQLTCPRYSEKVLDAFRAFRLAYTLKGPEFIPQPE